MGSPVEILYSPWWFEKLRGLHGSRAGAGLETFPFGSASGSVWRLKRGAGGSEVLSLKSALRENSQPLPGVRPDSPAARRGEGERAHLAAQEPHLER